VGAKVGPLGDCIRVQPLLPVCQCRSTVDGRVVTAASYSTPLHLALSTASTPCITLEWPVSVADCNNATTWNVQAFIAADIRPSQLVFITTAVVPGTLTIPGRSFYCPGTRSSTGTRTPGYPLTGLVAIRIGPRFDAICADLTLSGGIIEYVQSLKYLGVCIKTNRTFVCNFDHVK